jgi:hypothetical protein
VDFSPEAFVFVGGVLAFMETCAPRLPQRSVQCIHCRLPDFDEIMYSEDGTIIFD